MFEKFFLKRTLKKELKNKRFKEGRSLLVLAVTINRSKSYTKRLLSEMKARQISLTISNKKTEGYTLRRKS